MSIATASPLLWRVYVFVAKTLFEVGRERRAARQRRKFTFQDLVRNVTELMKAYLRPATATGWPKSVAQSRGPMVHAPAHNIWACQKALTVAASLCEAYSSLGEQSPPARLRHRRDQSLKLDRFVSPQAIYYRITKR